MELAARRDRIDEPAGEASEAALKAAVERLHAVVRAREQACVDALLRLYRFRPDDARLDELPLADGRWEDDLFNPETLRQMGVRLGTGAAAGAAAGVGVDLQIVVVRLDRDQSLSFLEFNYMILQAYDFLELYRRYDCRLQMGGSDQWGNIVNGIDLTRRVLDGEIWGLTSPLLTTSTRCATART